MASWFCSSFCQTANQSKNEIIFVNNNTEEIVKYGNKLSSSKYLNLNLHNGFIMVRKSMYDKYLQRCQFAQKPFTDEQFPPIQKSISEKDLNQFSQLSHKTIVWKRIPELYKNCELVKDKIESADIQQGNVGDCYFLAAISALAEHQDNILQIFGKKDLKSMVKNEFGIYKFVINVAGQPQEIVVDDFIPVYEKSERPVFCKPVNNEFWVVLLQKVWAKINKSYRNIAYGNPHEVMNRFSVAPVFYHNIPQHFYLERKVENSRQIQGFETQLWQSILQGHKQNFPMCCGSRQRVRTEGIKPSHSYSLLGVFQFVHKGKQVRILKLRNPWGHTEYEGDFSEKDPIWDSIDIKIKNQILQGKQNDGIFIIPFEQFLPNFQSIDIAHTKTHYNYIFKPVQFVDSEAQFYRISIDKEAQAYITFEKEYIRDSKSSHYQNNGISKIFIVEELENGNLQYVDCALETSLADVTVRCKRLKPGSYIVMIENEDLKKEQSSKFYSKASKLGTLSVYSSSSCAIEKLAEVKDFLQEFFYTHGIKYNREKKKIGAFENDWISKKIIPQSGYGYICINLDERGSKRFLLSMNRNVILQQGFLLILPKEIRQEIKDQNYQELALEIRPGQCLVFLFKIDFRRENLTLSFPPQGFDIKKII